MKYEFTGETKEFLGKTLRRVRAVANFGDVRAGDLGGWIEKEGILSQDGACWVCGNAQVCGDARVCGNARVWGDALVWGDAQVWGDARVCGNAQVWGDARVCGNAQVCGDARVCGNAQVWGDAQVCGTKHLISISPIGSRNDTVTFMRTKNRKIAVAVGCFRGDIDEFEKAVSKTHGDNEHAQAYRMAIEMAKLCIDLSEEGV